MRHSEQYLENFCSFLFKNAACKLKYYLRMTESTYLVLEAVKLNFFHSWASPFEYLDEGLNEALLLLHDLLLSLYLQLGHLTLLLSQLFLLPEERKMLQFEA